MSQDNAEILTVTATFLNTFGYVGVGLLLGAVAAWFLRRRFMPGFWVSGTLALCFVLIFGVLDIITRHFPQLIVQRPPLLLGRVMEVAQDHRVDLAAGTALRQRPYMRRTNHEDDATLANHSFIFARRLDPRCMTLSITPPDPASPPGAKAEPTFYAVPLAPAEGRASPYDELVLALRSRPGAPATVAGQWVRGDEAVGAALRVVEMPPTALSCADVVTAAAVPASAPGWFEALVLRRALAQPAPDARRPPLTAQGFAPLLRSDDPFVRRQARSTLGAQGAAAAPAIDGLLAAPDYRLRLGALTAIGAMRPEERQALPDAVWHRVDALRADADPTMRGAAEAASAGRPR
jgi:hypothetical protein